MDIEEFYDEDERRRASAEIQLGTEWRDGSGVRYELNWVEDTGELYIMREPVPHEWEDPFGGIHVNASEKAPVDGMTVEIVAKIASRAELDEILSGWETTMASQNGVSWLVSTLKSAGVGTTPSALEE
ncbi:MAG: hypothetical protein ACYDEP_13750 [Acidimicrobiales bacterium]|jgi:hypothetical protein